MKKALHILIIVLFLAAVAGSETLGANFAVPAGDGWYTWQVDAADGSELAVYAKMRDGAPVALRVRSDSICYSRFKVEATDLGRVDVDQSVAWLQESVAPSSRLSTEALIAIALHAGDLPDEILDRLLSG